jgi:hypothetical protein
VKGPGFLRAGAASLTEDGADNVFLAMVSTSNGGFRTDSFSTAVTVRVIQPSLSVTHGEITYCSGVT